MCSCFAYRDLQLAVLGNGKILTRQVYGTSLMALGPLKTGVTVYCIIKNKQHHIDCPSSMFLKVPYVVFYRPWIRIHSVALGEGLTAGTLQFRQSGNVTVALETVRPAICTWISWLMSYASQRLNPELLDFLQSPSRSVFTLERYYPGKAYIKTSLEFMKQRSELSALPNINPTNMVLSQKMQTSVPANINEFTLLCFSIIMLYFGIIVLKYFWCQHGLRS